MHIKALMIRPIGKKVSGKGYARTELGGYHADFHFCGQRCAAVKFYRKE